MRRRAGGLGPLCAVLVAAVAASPPAARAQPPRVGRHEAHVRDLGPGRPGRDLRDVLAHPHDVIVAPDSGLTLRRDTTIARTLLVLGGPTRVAAAVHGDLVVIGDLYLRPGARIDGRAIAYGGGAYNSALALVQGGVTAYRDVTFDAETDPATGAVALSYRELQHATVHLVSLPGIYGARIPTYTRVDGVGLTAGPEIALGERAIVVEPVVTYRSHIGTFDPGVHVTTSLGRRSAIDLTASRGTFTNDAWARIDLVNSFVTFGTGGDARNYYRADRGEATYARRFEVEHGEIEPFVGGLVERSWSIPRTFGTPAPFAVFGLKTDPEGIGRPNPLVTGGTIASAIAGVRFNVRDGDVASVGSARLEMAPRAPGGRRFAQLTAGALLRLPAFSDHRLGFGLHAIASFGDSTPSQRWAYLGGGPTVPSILLDSLGGDRLIWTETRYTIPLHAIRLPLVGSPNLMFRHIIGGAGVGTVGTLVQNVGVRFGIGPVRFDYTFDPTGAGRRNFGVSVGFF